MRPTRTTSTERACPASGTRCSYLVLLRVGLAVPSLLPETRCALTTPFHPYPYITVAGGLFSAALSLREIFLRNISLIGGYPTPFSVEPGLSSVPARTAIAQSPDRHHKNTSLPPGSRHITLGRQDSNLRSRDQNPVPYHLATPQNTSP